MPTLLFGIPGSGSMAVFLGVMILLGLEAGPAAIEMGLVAVQDGETRVRIRATNTGALTEAVILTPNGVVEYDGVPGTAAPIVLNFMEVIGSKTGTLLPTGHPIDVIVGIEVTCIDVAVPMVIAQASAFGMTDYETKAEIDETRAFYERMEPIRRIIERAHTEGLDKIEARFQELAPTLQLGDRLHWLREKGRVDAVVADCARGFDIILMGRFACDDPHVEVHPDKVAMQSGRPVLIVPGRYAEPANHQHVVVAWDSGRAAARALSDAMQILESTALVTILTVGDDPLSRPASELENHLERHGAKAEHVHLDACRSVAEAILGFCADREPGLLVMGAYEHSKFREDLLGGVTAMVLRECPLPVLMSH